MASDNELQIVLTLIDNASKELKKITGEVKKDTEEISKQSDKASKSIKDGFKEAGSELKEFRRAMFAATAVITSIILATKEWSKYNRQTADDFNTLGDNIRRIVGLIGSLFAPTLNALNQALQSSMNFIVNMFNKIHQVYTEFFEKISFGIQYLVAFTSALKEGVSVATAHKIAMDTAKNAVKEMVDVFRVSFDEDINFYIAKNIQAIQQLTYEYDAYYNNKLNKQIISTQREIERLNFFITTAKQGYQSLWVTAGNMRDAFVTGWSNSMAKMAVEGGKFKDIMSTFFIDMAGEFIRQVVRMITQWLVFLALKGIASFFGLFHSGGTIESPSIDLGTIFVKHQGGLIRAHNGLAIDEVPIIAQTGEGILSRRGMANLGGADMLNRLNSGYGMARQTSIHIEINNPTVRSDEDIDKLVEEVSNKLAREAERL